MPGRLESKGPLPFHAPGQATVQREAQALKAMLAGRASARAARLRFLRLLPVIQCLFPCLFAYAFACESGQRSDSGAQRVLRESTPAAPQGLHESAQRALPAAALGPKVAFLGDSLAAGLHLPAAQAFPAVAQRLLAARGVAFELLNAGVSGDTSAGGLRRVDWILKQAPAVVVVELGGNDGLRGLPVSAIEGNLRGILTRIQARGAKALLLGIRIPSSYGADYVHEFEAVYPRLSSELRVAFVPFFMEGVAGVPTLNLPDGIHPTAEGHERLAHAISEPLAQLIAAAGAGRARP